MLNLQIYLLFFQKEKGVDYYRNFAQLLILAFPDIGLQKEKFLCMYFVYGYILSCDSLFTIICFFGS